MERLTESQIKEMRRCELLDHLAYITHHESFTKLLKLSTGRLRQLIMWYQVHDIR